MCEEDGDDDCDDEGEEERQHDGRVAEDEAAVVGVDDELGRDGRPEERQRGEVVLLHGGAGGVVRRDAQAVPRLGAQVQDGEGGGSLAPPVARDLEVEIMFSAWGSHLKFPFPLTNLT